MTNIDKHVLELLAEDRRGVEIAQALKDEGYSSSDVRDALYKAGFVVVWEGEGDFRLLHVSDCPMETGLAVLISVSEPRALPSVCWPQKCVWIDV